MKQFYLAILLVFLGMNLIPAQSNDLNLIKKYLVDSGTLSKDIEDLTIDSQSFSKSMQANIIYANQSYNDIPIRNAIGSFAIKNNKVVSFKGTFITDVISKINSKSPILSGETAIRTAANYLNFELIQNLQKNTEKSTSKTSIFKSNISNDEIPVELVYELVENKLILCWDLSISTKNGENWYSVRIDARDGSLRSQNDWVLHCSFDSRLNDIQKKPRTNSILETKSYNSSLVMTPTYNVLPLPYVESPNHGNRELISGQEDAIASPFGWHDTNGIEGPEFTRTQGNNVLAYEDLDANNITGHQPDGGDGLIFDFPYDQNATTGEYQNASITNLFYTNNVTHDIWYQYGFDEASGNFQVNNYGKGGDGNDAVIADSQDGSRFNNASFATPSDGSNPRMQMHLYDPVSITQFRINNTTLAGEYLVIENNFFPDTPDLPSLPNNVTADLVLAIDDDSNPDPNDACSSLTNASDMRRKIAVVRRGACDFASIVLKCQQAGALIVIIVNNDSEDFEIDGVIFSSIPTYGINQQDGEAIIAQMENTTVNVSIGAIPPQNWFANADSSFDNSIVIHEYGHGISHRLTGGRNITSCLWNDEQMGEGWSDWFGIVMTIKPGDKGTDYRGRGTFANGQPITGPGNRPNPYSTDMSINPVTYGDVSDDVNYSRPHGIGSIWASILWDMTWAFIDRDGYDADLYNGTGGNNLAMQLVIDGLKLQSCSPGFVDGRDGILAAADLLPNSNANKCLIWEVFARRGVGFSADQGSSQSRFDQVEAFDLPPVSQLDCSTLSVDDFNANVFNITPNPSKGLFDIKVSQNIGESSISIFDLNGRQVFKKDTELRDVYRVSTNLKSGIYLIRIEAKDGSAISTSKIVIQ